MNEITHLPTRLRVVRSECDAQLEREKPRFANFALRARRSLLEHWRQLLGSDELSPAELQEEIEATRAVMQQLLDVHQADHPVQPPPGAA